MASRSARLNPGPLGAMRRFILSAALALASLSCATSGNLLDAEGNVYPVRGNELCPYRTFVINPASNLDAASAERTRAAFSAEIAKLGLALASRSDADLLIDLDVSDRTECVHCPEDHTHWRWLVVVSEARTNKFVAQVAREELNFDDYWEYRRLLELAAMIDEDVVTRIAAWGENHADPDVHAGEPRTR